MSNIFVHISGISGLYIFVELFLRILSTNKFKDLRNSCFDFVKCLPSGILTDSDNFAIKKFRAIMLFFVLSFALDLILQKVVYALAPSSIANVIQKIMSILPIGPLLFFSFIIFIFIQSGNDSTKVLESIISISLIMIFLSIFFFIHAAIYASNIFEAQSPGDITELDKMVDKHEVYQNPYLDNMILWNGIAIFILALRNLIVNYDTSQEFDFGCTFAVYSFIGILLMYFMGTYMFYVGIRIYKHFKNTEFNIDNYLKTFSIDSWTMGAYFIGMMVLLFDSYHMSESYGKNEWIGKYIIGAMFMLIFTQLYDWRKKVFVELIDQETT
jgi:hypothetical protein